MSKKESIIQEKTSKTEKISLSTFIEDNHKIISVLGIFSALTVFSRSLQLKALGDVLSFMFLTLTIIVWFELWGKFPSEETTGRLSWFETILTFTILGLVIYSLLEYRGIWDHLLMVPILGIIVTPISKLLKRYDVFNRLFHTQPGKLKWLRYTFGITLLLVFLAASMMLAGAVAPLRK